MTNLRKRAIRLLQAGIAGEDTRPLAEGESRTYVFKINELIIGRQTASCATTDLEVLYELTYALTDFLGCNDVVNVSDISNTGCRALQVVNSFGTIRHTIASGENFNFTEIGEIHILLAGMDTLGISDAGFVGAINTGDCTGTSPEESTTNLFPEDFSNIDVLFTICQGDTLTLPTMWFIFQQ